MCPYRYVWGNAVSHAKCSRTTVNINRNLKKFLLLRHNLFIQTTNIFVVAILIVYKEGNTWWITETSDTGIGVKYSPDGRAWTQGVSIFGGGLSWWGQYNGNSKTVWAPDIHVWNGKAIMYYAVSTFGNQKSAIGLATASSIAQGNWVDKGVVITSAPGDNFNAIDPNFVVDKSGQP